LLSVVLCQWAEEALRALAVAVGEAVSGLHGCRPVDEMYSSHHGRGVEGDSSREFWAISDLWRSLEIRGDLQRSLAIRGKSPKR
jgi:hypothetical protein